MKKYRHFPSTCPYPDTYVVEARSYYTVVSCCTCRFRWKEVNSNTRAYLFVEVSNAT